MSFVLHTYRMKEKLFPIQLLCPLNEALQLLVVRDEKVVWPPTIKTLRTAHSLVGSL